MTIKNNGYVPAKQSATQAKSTEKKGFVPQKLPVKPPTNKK